MNRELFNEWAKSIFLPEIEMKRNVLNYDGPVLLLCDGCTAHFDDYFLNMCSYLGVVLIVEPPGSFDQIQALDLGIFGIQKVIKSGMRSNPDLDPQSDDITRIINSFQRAAVRNNVVYQPAFRQAGIFITAEGIYSRKI